MSVRFSTRARELKQQQACMANNLSLILFEYQWFYFN